MIGYVVCLTMKQHNELQTVYDSLGNWWGQIHTRNTGELYDINRVSEDVAAGLLNLVFNLELKNLNPDQVKKSFPLPQTTPSKSGTRIPGNV